MEDEVCVFGRVAGEAHFEGWPASSFSLPAGVCRKMVMLPSSEGWPPPWGWKIVSSVVRMKSCSGSGSAALNRLRFASDSSESGQKEVILVFSVRIDASCW